MGNLLDKVNGYKTYITAILAMVANVGLQLHWFTPEHVALVNAILLPLGLAFLRDAVAKVEGK